MAPVTVFHHLFPGQSPQANQTKTPSSDCDLFPLRSVWEVGTFLARLSAIVSFKQLFLAVGEDWISALVDNCRNGGRSRLLTHIADVTGGPSDPSGRRYGPSSETNDAQIHEEHEGVPRRVGNRGPAKQRPPIMAPAHCEHTAPELLPVSRVNTYRDFNHGCSGLDSADDVKQKHGLLNDAEWGERRPENATICMFIGTCQVRNPASAARPESQLVNDVGSSRGCERANRPFGAKRWP